VFTGFGGDEYEYECNQDFECGWRWGSANSTAGFDGIVYLGASGRRRRSLPLGWSIMLNRGAGDFADKISMGESTLGWNTDKSGGLASLQYSLHTGQFPQGLSRWSSTSLHNLEPATASYAD
jgi:hypothetical protein